MRPAPPGLHGVTAGRPARSSNGPRGRGMAEISLANRSSRSSLESSPGAWSQLALHREMLVSSVLTVYHLPLEDLWTRRRTLQTGRIHAEAHGSASTCSRSWSASLNSVVAGSSRTAPGYGPSPSSLRSEPVRLCSGNGPLTRSLEWLDCGKGPRALLSGNSAEDGGSLCRPAWLADHGPSSSLWRSKAGRRLGVGVGAGERGHPQAVRAGAPRRRYQTAEAAG